ncbi:hypothetical protein F4860DRAFT_515744 [Xylaria cubensis]|nr:hypothetical protein F4860DRAFT_515744 [Xylaria cubensis]
MAVKEHQPLVDQCCTFCCKAVDFGTHDYCGSHDACHRASVLPLSEIVAVTSISLLHVTPSSSTLAA